VPKILVKSGIFGFSDVSDYNLTKKYFDLHIDRFNNEVYNQVDINKLLQKQGEKRK